MPSQEPAVDDKDDDVDLPSEETDGSKGCFLPAGGTQALLTPECLLASPFRHESFPDACSPRVNVGSMAAIKGAGDMLSRASPQPQAEMCGASDLPWGPCLHDLLPWESRAGVSLRLHGEF